VRATRSATALLISLGSSARVGMTLGEILAPYFRLKAIECWPDRALSDQVVMPDGDFWRSNPALVFLFETASSKKQTKELLELIQKDFPATPVVVLVDAATDPNEMLAWLNLGAADFLTVPLTAIGGCRKLPMCRLLCNRIQIGWD
jgi:hypothetical protein